MSSATGQVQQMRYTSTFPLLINLEGRPTYLISLKDNAGLVKMYAMVNISKYQNVAIGETVAECVKDYQSLLKQNGISADSGAGLEVKAVIEKISPVVIEGNSHYYITLVGRKEIFDVDVSVYPQIVTYDAADTIKLTYLEGAKLCEVTGIQ